ncbi:hypothetical protein DFP73DRAFT_555488 [Morchella snyderi]|nr:hypothetical protein DFP73DRAFT_555488 [Morchella snyderi]
MGFFILMSCFFLHLYFWTFSSGRALFFARSLVDGLTAWRLHFFLLFRVNLHISFVFIIYNCVDTGGRGEGGQD